MKKQSASAYDTKGKRKYLNQAENLRFLSTIDSFIKDKKSFCLFLYYTGCRISEALNLKLGDIDIETNIVVIKCLKKRNQSTYRRVPIPESLIADIYNLNPTSTDLVWDFSRTCGWRTIKKAMLLSKISGSQATSKGLRHSFGVRAVMNNVPLNLIKKWMGHSDLSVTAIYLEVRDEEEQEFIVRTW